MVRPVVAIDEVKNPDVKAKPRLAAKTQSKKAVTPRRGGRVTEQRQQEIVELIAPMFLDRGYDQVSIDEIVRRVGGSKRTLYERFGGKAGLFEMVIKAYCAKVHRDMFAGIEQHENIQKQLEAIGTHFLSMILNPNILEQHRLMVSMGRNFPSLAQMFFEAGPQRAYDLIASWIEKQQKAGKIAAGNAAVMAELFLDMLTGKHQLAMLTSSFSKSSKQDVSATVKEAAKVFLNGVSTKQPSKAKLRS